MPSILTRTKDGVLKIYNEVHKNPIFAIYEGTRQLTCCTDETPKKRYAALEDFLSVMEQSGTTAAFDLRCYEAANKNGKVNTQDPYFAFLPFKVNDSDQAIEIMRGKGSGGMAPNNNYVGDLMDAKLKLIQMQFEHALEKKDAEILKLQQEAIDGDDEEEDEDHTFGRILGTIGAVGEKHTWLQEPVKKLVTTFSNIFQGVGAKYTAMTETPMSVNGVTEAPAADESIDDQLKWANLTLVNCYRAKHGVEISNDGKFVKGDEAAMNAADAAYVKDMVNLAKLASTKPDTYEMARNMLK